MCLFLILLAIAVFVLAAFWRQILLALLVIGIIILVVYLIRSGRLR